MIRPPAPISSAHRHLRLTSVSLTLIFAALVPNLSARAQEPAADTSTGVTVASTTYPTNSQLVRDGIRLVTSRIFDGFPFVRPKPLWITPAEGQTKNLWFEEAAGRELFDRGCVVQESPGDDTAKSVIWAVRYRFDRFSLSLPQSARHSFLGKIWVRRALDISVQMQIWDMESGQLLWSNAADSTWSDWVPKARLKDLSDPSSPFLSPIPPVTTLEKLTEPAIVISAAGVLTALFFVVR